MKREYYFIDVDLKNKKIIDFGITPFATHTGRTNFPNVYRIFLTKGQFNKFAQKLNIK
jgi:hypothetical protein